MAYKDKDKQREASKEAMRRYREKGITKAKDVIPAQSPDVIPENSIVTPEGIAARVPANYGQPDCECKHCEQTRNSGKKLIINHGRYKTASQLADNEVNRVSLPGDVDYDS